MILNIVKYPDLTLRQPSLPVKSINKEIRILIRDMQETMYRAAGIGLSAIQVGQALQILVFDTGNEFGTLINPIIKGVRGVTLNNEGCLSLPGTYKEIERYEEIKVEYFNERGERVVKAFKGLAAVVIQHEIDHFYSTLIIDNKVNNW